MSKVVPMGAAFAFPGTEGFTVVDLEPGRYIAVCFIPQGLTPEVASSSRRKARQEKVRRLRVLLRRVPAPTWSSARRTTRRA